MAKTLPAVEPRGEKIPAHIRFSDRHVTFFMARAKIMQCSFAESVRRGLDSFIDSEEAKKPVERILVLDRDSQSLRPAR